jgi:DNA-binding NarL/FixJ family response regulator
MSEPDNSKLSILVAEDHELTRYGLCMALEGKGRFHNVAEAEDGQQAVDKVRQTPPDLILMDIGMPVMDGIAATRQIKEQFPNVKILMLTSHKDEEEVYAALAAGADAYCMKDIKIDRLLQVIDMVMEGALWMDPAVARLVLKALPGNDAGGGPGSATQTATRKRYNTELTEREMEVLHLIVAGKSNKEIAHQLDVTIHTAKAHVCNIIQKLSVDDRTQVAVKALQEGLLDKG